MTVAWSTIKPAIVAFVAAASGVPSNKVVWDDEAKAILQEPYIELTVSAERSIGDDDVELENVTDEGVAYLDTTVAGTREFTLSIRYRSRSAATGSSARQVLETIRGALNSPKMRETLESADVAFLESLAIVTTSYTHDNRRESVAVLDVRMSAKSERAALAADRVDPVESVEITPTRNVTELPLQEVP